MQFVSDFDVGRGGVSVVDRCPELGPTISAVTDCTACYPNTMFEKFWSSASLRVVWPWLRGVMQRVFGKQNITQIAAPRAVVPVVSMDTKNSIKNLRAQKTWCLPVQFWTVKFSAVDIRELWRPGSAFLNPTTKFRFCSCRAAGNRAGL